MNKITTTKKDAFYSVPRIICDGKQLPMKMGSSQPLTSVTPGVSGDPDGLRYGSEGAEGMWLQGNLFDTQAFGTSFAQRHKETVRDHVKKRTYRVRTERETRKDAVNTHTRFSCRGLHSPTWNPRNPLVSLKPGLPQPGHTGGE